VNFSLDLICILALALTDFCSADGLAPPYMDALVTAVAENDVTLRLLLESSAFNGLENRIGIRWFLDELAEEGALDNVEIKWFNGKMHDKAFLIDNELLVVGSQNFHYSAWESPSLTEYSIATEDRNAIGDFVDEFEFQWGKGIPIGEGVNNKET
jgi:phosphatidylserine/phosphatidylglycerophosphate/cardiolipin synthase-like enzyme